MTSPCPHPRHARAPYLFAAALAVACSQQTTDGGNGGNDAATADVAPDSGLLVDGADDAVPTTTDTGALPIDSADKAEDSAFLQDDAAALDATSDVATEPLDTGAPDLGPEDSGPPPCQEDSECPAPLNPCDKAVCTAGKCAKQALPEGADCDTTSGCALEGKCQANKCVVTKAKDCDDGNVCTADDCDLGTGICTHAGQLDNAVCSDGSGCTKEALCYKGSCVAKAQKQCDDGNVCTKDACDPKTGKCIALPGLATDTCDDDNACTKGDSCDPDGNCVPGKPICGCESNADCLAKDDGNLCNGQLFCDQSTKQCQLNPASVVVCELAGDGACAKQACDPGTGACIIQPEPTGTICTDGNPCTVGDACNGKGQCSGGTKVCACTKNSDCLSQNDGDPCNGTLYCNTEASPAACEVNPATVVKCPTQFDTACSKLQCSKKTGQCELNELGVEIACDDDNKCTVGDHCLAGKCKAGTDTCSCKQDADCGALEDGNLCNGTLFCNKVSGQCDLNPNTVVTCPVAGNTYCKKNRCDAKTGKCAFEPDHEGKQCDDGDDQCTPENEYCKAGECTASKNICLCTQDADCKDDGDLCNGVPFCNIAKKKCETNPASKVVCSTVDDSTCIAAQCVKKTGKCALKPRNQGFSCDADGDKCTEGDYCGADGSCVAGTNTCQCQADSDCAKFGADDKCGSYFCNGTTNKCQLNPTTVPFCSPLDDTACAQNTCDSKTGKCELKAVNDNQPCDADGSNCTVGDKCAAGKCAAGPSSCQCVADVDCAKFGDGNKCSGTLKCNGNSGQCEIDKSTVVDCQDNGNTACLENRCDPSDGTCKQTAVNHKSPCGKGTLCTGVPLCNEGTCTTGAVVDCDDDNPCTQDSCDDYKGCLHVGNTGQKCDDGNQCTHTDVCVKGACTGAKVACDEGTPCTTDVCHPLKGCTYTPRGGDCDDGSACTTDGVCVGIKCVTKSMACDDSDGCTDDSCDPKIGCVFQHNTAACDDGNKCTKADACLTGACVGKPLSLATDCDDGNPCTKASCSSDVGCVQTKLHSSGKTIYDCDDGSWCTVSRCNSGVCKAVAPRCNSKDIKGKCIEDICDAKAQKCSTKTLQPGQACDDGNVCSTASACLSDGTCKATKALSCSDGNACTFDRCDPFKGCYFDNIEKNCGGKYCGCEDGDACTLNTFCSSGVCQGAVARDCDDAEPCTVDSCDPKSGCVNKAFDDNAVCGDAEACQTTGVCKSGKCSGAIARPWSHGNLGIEAQCGDLVDGDDDEWFAFGRVKNLDGVWEPAWMHINFAGRVRKRWSKPSTANGMLWAGLRGKDGLVAVGHTYEETNGGRDALFLRVAGEATVTVALALGGSKDEEFRGIAAAKDGGHVLVGANRSKGAGAADGWIVKLSKDDKLLWDKTVGTPVDDDLLSVAALDDGTWTAVGTVGSYGGLIQRIGDDGALLKQRIDGGAPEGSGNSKVHHERKYLVVKALAGGNSLVGGRSLHWYDKDLNLTKELAYNNKALQYVHDIDDRKGEDGYLLDRSQAVITDVAGKTLRTSAHVAGNGPAIDGLSSGRRIVSVGAWNFVSMTGGSCALKHPDDFGNTTCEASGGCFTKKWAECQDKDLCTKEETCLAGKCTSQPTVTCKDPSICYENKGCNPSTGKCEYPVLPDGSACKTSSGPCALAGECQKGDCLNDSMAVFNTSVTVFYGCCGEMDNHKRRDYQRADSRRVAVRSDGRMIAMGKGWVDTDSGYKTNIKNNSLYGQLIQGTGAAGNRIGWNVVNAGCNKLKNYIYNIGNAQPYEVAGLTALASREVVVLARLPSVAGLKSGDCSSASVTKFETQVRRMAVSNGSLSNPLVIGDANTVPVDIKARADGSSTLALASHYNGTSKKREFSVFSLDHTGGFHTQKLTSTFTRQFGHADDPQQLVTLPDSSYLVCGRTTRVDGLPQHVAARFDKDNKQQWLELGDQQQGSQLNGCGWWLDGPVLVGTKQENIVGTVANQVWIRSFTANGALRFDAKLLPFSGSTYGRDVIVHGGELVVGGEVNGKSALVRVDRYGYLAGERTFGNQIEQWRGMPDGGFVGVGWSGKLGNSGGSIKPYVLRTDPFGNAPCDVSGKCVGKKFSDCDDGNGCTVDACVGDKGCTNTKIDDGRACEDGNPCTLGDLCKDSKCAAGKKAEQYAACDDGDKCTKGGKCDTSGVCQSSPTCNDNKPCTVDKCDADGKRTFTAAAENAACDDGNWCTAETKCDKDGQCGGGKTVCIEKVVAKESFDCGTTGFDSTPGANGVKWAIDGSPSVPGFHSKDCSWNVNNGTDYNSEKSPVTGTSGKTWTLPLDGRVELRFWSYFGVTPASEAEQDFRVIQVLSGTTAIKTAGWNNENDKDINAWGQRTFDLTSKRGVGAIGLEVRQYRNNSNNGGAGWFIDDLEIVQIQLADGVPCTFDNECDDGEACTANTCVNKRCKNVVLKDGDSCDDGDKCTTGDTCKAGKCAVSTPTVCDDGLPCTKDTCHKTQGCKISLEPENTACDDNNACTTNTTCQKGACLGTDACEDGNPCTFEACDNGACKKTNAPNGTPVARGVTCSNGNPSFPTNRKARAFIGGEASCAIDNTNALWCWGLNTNGTVGDGTKTKRLTRVKVNLTGKVWDVDSGDWRTCAVVENAGERNVWCWGRNRDYAAGGSKYNEELLTPTKVTDIKDATAICTGEKHTCALVNGGRVRCFGHGGDYKTGSASESYTVLGTYVLGLQGAVKIACGRSSTCAQMRDGSVKCWGRNNLGQLGRGATSHRERVGAKVVGLEPITALEAGGEHYCAITGHKVMCWGNNQHGQLGDNTLTNRSTPVHAKTYSGAIYVGAGRDSTCATVFRHSTYDKDKSRTYATQCWGNNDYGQLGNGNTAPRFVPSTNFYEQGKNIGESNWVKGFEKGTQQLTDYDQTPCARYGNNELWCWGRGDGGNVGNNNLSHRTTRVRVSGF